MRKFILLLAMFSTLTSCSPAPYVGSANLMASITGNPIVPIKLDEVEAEGERAKEIVDFSLDIFKEICKDQNVLISPLSIITALAMTANGAEGETLAQMEEIFGISTGDLNEYLYAYRSYLPTGDKYKMSLANSIWFKDDENFTVEKGFLQTNKDYYDSDVYKALFDDGTRNDINAWVNEKTNGLIDKLLDESIPEDAVMYLVNALAFDAQWEDIYEDIAVREGKFTAASGAKRDVDFMHSTEYSYIKLPGAVGFSKPYADSKYYFTALLPDEGVEMGELLEALDGEALVGTLKEQTDDEVHASMPKFEFEYDHELSEVLEGLGMVDAFDAKLADFTSLGRYTDANIFINRVIHKTKIRVDEKGTEAGAVTAVEMFKVTSMPVKHKVVNLDRPFFFMIVDGEFGLPIFMGVLNDVGP